jgi:hypothetical protein
MITAMIIIKAVTHGEFFIGKIDTCKASRWNIICVGGGQADFSGAEFVDPDHVQNHRRINKASAIFQFPGIFQEKIPESGQVGKGDGSCGRP